MNKENIIYTVVERDKHDVTVNNFVTIQSAQKFFKQNFEEKMKSMGYNSIEELREWEDLWEDTVLIAIEEWYVDLYWEDYELDIRENTLFI